MRRISLLIIAIILVCQLAFAQTPAQTPAPATQKKSSLVERVDNTGIIQLEANSFNDLNTKQKALAYWLTQASIAIHPIIFDQKSRFGLRQKRILEAIVARPQGVKPEALTKIVNFTKLFWANRGNHNDTTAQKFLPNFSFEELQEAALQAVANGSLMMTADELRQELNELRPTLFDQNFEPTILAKSPQGDRDILQSSANNFYSDVRLDDLKNFTERYPLNSRVVKLPNGKLIEQVYRAGSNGTSPGLYAPFLNKAIECLTQARRYAEAPQAAVIDALIRYYQTGEPQDWLKFGGDWVRNDVPVDFANGFIEVYLDARGAKGTSQSFVTVTDQKVNRLMVEIAEDAQYFEDHAPWDDKYKKQGVKPPLARAVETLIETGDFTISTVGVNLPNENEIHQKYGTKSFLFTGSSRAFNEATGDLVIEEFGASAREIEIIKKYGAESEDLMTALHEIIGHGSGKLNPKLTKEPAFYLKEYASTLEEARADLMALWFVYNPTMLSGGLISHPEVADAMYYDAARVALTQLRSIPNGNTIEEDHQRNRQLIVNYIIDKTGAIEFTKRNGKTFVVIKDFGKMREGVGMLLAELMRIKAEGDYEAIKALVDKYAVKFDPVLRDEVVARYQSLKLPTYYTGINPELIAKFNDKGEVIDVEMIYPRDFVKQQLRYSAMFEPALLPDTTPQQ